MHDTLTQLVEDLEAFSDENTGELARVRERLHWAKGLRELATDAEYIAKWEGARQEIEDSTNYRGLGLEPQPGLVPIGMNPYGLYEFYHLRSAWDPAFKLSPAEIPLPTCNPEGFIDVRDDTGIIFILLPGGEFWMGAQSEDKDRPNYDINAWPFEKLHRETVKPFFLAAHQTTQAQWMRLSEDGVNPSFFGPAWRQEVTLSHAVDTVSWNMSNELFRLHQLRLPRSAEWEYGCRAGTETPYFTGTDPRSLDGYGNFRSFPTTRDPVGTFRPNRWGFFDMAGNLFEWCEDYYESPPNIISGWTTDRGRIGRSAPWFLAPERNRSATFQAIDANYRMGIQGVRAARSIVSMQ